MQRYEKLSNYASFSASFSRLFLLLFPLLFQSVFSLLPSAFPICFPAAFLTFFNLFLCVTPVAEMAIEPIRHPSQRDIQAFPCRTLLRSCPLSRTSDRRLIFQSPSLDTPDFTAVGAIGLPFAAFCRFLLKKGAFWGAVGLIIGEPLILLLLARVSGAIFCMEGGGAKMYASV